MPLPGKDVAFSFLGYRILLEGGGEHDHAYLAVNS